MNDLADVLPLVAAAVALLAGILLGKLGVRRYPAFGKFRAVALAFFVGLILFGSYLSSVAIGALIAAGLDVVAAKYIGLSVLCFGSGAVMSIGLGRQ